MAMTAHLLVLCFCTVACDADEHRDVCVRWLIDPQSLASVDLLLRRYAIFEVLLAIGAFSVIRLALLLLNEIEISVWMIVAVVVGVEERGNLWSSTYNDHRVVTMNRVYHLDNYHLVLPTDYDGS
jgi:hypothetical protein